MKPVSLFLPLSLCFFSFVFSDGSPSDNHLNEKHPSTVITQPQGIITPPAGPRVDRGLGYVTTFDFIWWKSQVGSLDYITIGSHAKSPDFSYEPGFKIGLGLDMNHDGWDVFAEYTWLYGPELKNGVKSDSIGFSSIVSAFATSTPGALSTIPASEASAMRKSHFNVLDMELGRNFFISRRLTLRPNIGIKLAYLYEKNAFTYIGASEQTEIIQSNTSLKQRLAGIGIRGGINSVWHFTKSWGIYGDLAITALLSKFHDKSNTSTLTLGESSPSETNYGQKSQDIIPVIEASLGLTYMAWLYQERYQIAIKAGWEEQIWVNYNKNLNTPISYTGNLSLQGLTLRATFAF